MSALEHLPHLGCRQRWSTLHTAFVGSLPAFAASATRRRSDVSWILDFQRPRVPLPVVLRLSPRCVGLVFFRADLRILALVLREYLLHVEVLYLQYSLAQFPIAPRV